MLTPDPLTEGALDSVYVPVLIVLIDAIVKVAIPVPVDTVSPILMIPDVIDSIVSVSLPLVHWPVPTKLEAPVIATLVPACAWILDMVYSPVTPALIVTDAPAGVRLLDKV